MVRLLSCFPVLAVAIPTALAVSEWGQCGGVNYTGSTTCDAGLVCHEWNPYYFQCVTPSMVGSTTSSTSSSTTSSTPTSSITTSSGTIATTIAVTSSTASSTSTYTGTLPIGTLSPTGLAAAAMTKGKYIGCAYDNNHISDSDFTQLVLSQVNAMTPENSMKWNSLEQTQGNFDTSLWADRVVNITQLNNLLLRGHTLVWHSQLPDWVTSGSWTNATLTAVMQNHITGVMNKWKGQVYQWDVVNEALNEDGSLRASIFYNLIGEYYIDIAFNHAKSVDPDAILAINDYNIDGISSKSTGMYNLVNRVRGRGVPIEQIGIQAHLIVGQVPTTLQANWNNFVSLGVSIAITELDIRMPTPASSANLAQQATDYANVVNTCLAINQCQGITLWGLSDRYSWVPYFFSGQGAALPYDENLQPKPAYNSIIAALNA